MPVVALSIEFCNRLTRTWTHVEDLVWSRYRHRVGMRAAGVMWLPRTHPSTMHSERLMNQLDCCATSAYNLQWEPYRKTTPNSTRHPQFERKASYG